MFTIGPSILNTKAGLGAHEGRPWPKMEVSGEERSGRVGSSVSKHGVQSPTALIARGGPAEAVAAQRSVCTVFVNNGQPLERNKMRTSMISFGNSQDKASSVALNL